MNNALILCAALLCSTFFFSHAERDPAEEMAMEKRFRNFAFAKRFDTLGHTFAFAKRSALNDDDADEQLAEKRARFAFAKRARFAFAKRARFAFA